MIIDFCFKILLTLEINSSICMKLKLKCPFCIKLFRNISVTLPFIFTLKNILWFCLNYCYKCSVCLFKLQKRTFGFGNFHASTFPSDSFPLFFFFLLKPIAPLANDNPSSSHVVILAALFQSVAVSCFSFTPPNVHEAGSAGSRSGLIIILLDRKQLRVFCPK